MEAKAKAKEKSECEKSAESFPRVTVSVTGPRVPRPHFFYSVFSGLTKPAFSLVLCVNKVNLSLILRSPFESK